MNLEIITPEKKLFEGKVKAVLLPGKTGKFEVLNNHAPIISSLTKGQVKVTDGDNQIKFFEIHGGVIEMQNNKMIVLAD